MAYEISREELEASILEDEMNNRSLLESTGRQVGRLGRSLATGISGIADLPNLVSLGAHAAGWKKEPTFYEPISGRVQNKIDKLTHGYLRPENKIEEYVDTVSEGLAPLVLAPLTGGASLTGVAARGMAKHATGVAQKVAQKAAKIGANPYAASSSNIAGNVGSSLAAKAYSDSSENPSILGTILAGAAGGTGARSLLSPRKALAPATGAITKFDPEKYKRAIELDIPSTLGSTSHSTLPGRIEMLLSKTPGLTNRFEKVYGKQERGLAHHLGISTPEDLKYAVEHIDMSYPKKGAKGYHKRVSDVYEARSNKFKPREEAAILNKELIDVSDLIKDLEHEKNLSLTKAARDRFDKSKNGILLTELKNSIPNTEGSDIIRTLKDQGYDDRTINLILAKTNNEHPSQQAIGLHNLNELREKALQESLALRTPLGGGTPESREAAIRSSLLSGKRYEFMEKTGNKSEKHNAKEARKLWAMYKDEKDGMSHYVEKISGAENDVEAFKKLKKDARYYNVARQGLPRSERPKLAEAFMADLGSRQGRFNINAAYTAFKKLSEPVQNQFLKSLPDAKTRQNFNKSMDLIGDNKQLMEKFANTSNTAHTSELMTHLKKYGSVAAGIAGGTYLAPIKALTGIAAAKGAGNLWTDQKFLKHINDVRTGKEAGYVEKAIDQISRTMNQEGRQEGHRKSQTIPLITMEKGTEPIYISRDELMDSIKKDEEKSERHH